MKVHVARFDVFTAVRIQVDFFWIVTPRSVVVGCQRFRGPRCLTSPWRWRYHGPL